jgi:hypothetical protein
VDGTDGAFSEPLGLLLLPDGDVLVADSVNHALRRVRLSDGAVSTVAGNGAQLRERVAPGATAAELSTPWDLAWWDGRVVVAMAGNHQLWTWDPRPPGAAVGGHHRRGPARRPARRGVLRPALRLAVGDGVLWVADAETSALREVREGLVATAVGQGLFDFGHRDGPADEALFQHPLGVAVLPDGSVAVADTYNGARPPLRPGDADGGTLASDLAEPSDVLVDGDTLVVVESARAPAGPGAAAGVGPVCGARAAGAPVGHRRSRPGRLALRVAFVPPTGQHLDTRFGDPTELTVVGLPAGAGGGGRGYGAGAVPGARAGRRARGGAVGQRRGGRLRRGRRGVRRLPPLPAGLGHTRCGSWRARPPSWSWICARSERRRKCRWAGVTLRS